MLKDSPAEDYEKLVRGGQLFMIVTITQTTISQIRLDDHVELSHLLKLCRVYSESGADSLAFHLRQPRPLLLSETIEKVDVNIDGQVTTYTIDQCG